MWCFLSCFGEEIASLSLDGASLYDSDQEDRPVRVASDKRVRRYYALQERGRIPVPKSIRQTKFPLGYVKPQMMTTAAAESPFGVAGPSRITRVGKTEKKLGGDGYKGKYDKVQSEDEHDDEDESGSEGTSDDEHDDEGKSNLDRTCRE
jgi:hypothetical protein